MSNSLEIPQGVSLFHYEQETLILEKLDDVVSAAMEPVHILYFDGEVALTGLQHAANYLGLHVSTIRRYADKRILKAIKHPTGVRRIRVDSLKKVHAQMYSGFQDT